MDFTLIIYFCMRSCYVLCFIITLAGLPGFARDSRGIIIPISSAFYFYKKNVSPDHGIPKTLKMLMP